MCLIKNSQLAISKQSTELSDQKDVFYHSLVTAQAVIVT